MENHIENYIKEIEKIAAKCTGGQSDGYSQILRICDTIKEETTSTVYTVQETSDAFEEPYYLADEDGNYYVDEYGTVPTFMSKEEGETYLKKHFLTKREIIIKISAESKEDCIPLHESALLVEQNLKYRFPDSKIKILSEKDKTEKDISEYKIIDFNAFINGKIFFIVEDEFQQQILMNKLKKAGIINTDHEYNAPWKYYSVTNGICNCYSSPETLRYYEGSRMMIKLRVSPNQDIR